MRGFSENLVMEWDKLSAGDASFRPAFFTACLKTLLQEGELAPVFVAQLSPTMLQSRIPGAPEAGRDLLWFLAEQHDDASALLNLGIALWAGHGGPAAPAEACRIFERLIARPDLADDVRGGALLQLAQCYRDGSGVAQDLTRAVDLFEQAAVLGAPDAAYSAGLICQGEAKQRLPSGCDYPRAARAYALNIDDVRCQTNLGLLHLRSLVPDNDFGLGLNLLATAARSGDSEAISSLATSATIGERATAVLESLGYARPRGRSRRKA